MTTYIDHTNAGAEVEIDDAAKAKWLLDNGYISPKTPSKAKDADTRGIYATSPPADQDITLAENRERPSSPDKIKPHVANDDGATGGETVHGKNMGLDADLVSPDTAPTVKINTGKTPASKPKVADA